MPHPQPEFLPPHILSDEELAHMYSDHPDPLVARLATRLMEALNEADSLRETLDESTGI
jgi:hypothetical protein